MSARELYRQRMLERVVNKHKPDHPRVWNNRERWRTARLVIRVVLAYSPRSIGTALVIAGTLIQAIDATWEKKDG